MKVAISPPDRMELKFHRSLDGTFQIEVELSAGLAQFLIERVRADGPGGRKSSSPRIH